MTGAVTPVVAEDVSVRRGPRVVVSHCSFEAPAGVTALLGPNGAGKSSLLGAITGQFVTHAGTVTWGGERVDGRRSRLFLATLGWLPQSLTFPGRMRVRDVLLYAAWLKRASASDQRSAVDDMVASASLQDFCDRRVGQLSGGEQRRVALAAAMVGDPRVLLLDEPTVGLDPLQREHFHRRIDDAASTRAVILATHLLEDVAAVASRVILLHEGRVRFAGTVAEFCQGPGTVDTLRAALSRRLNDAPVGASE